MRILAFDTPARRASVLGLAALGFIALVAGGIGLAVYSARYVPSVAGGVGAAAVSLSQFFAPAPAPGLSVVPNATTTVSLSGATTTAAGTPPAKKPAAPAPGKETSGVYPFGGATTTAAAPGGLPDLVVDITAVGYLATTSADSFVASSTVPAGSRPAVKFVIKNIGAGTAGPWRWSASIPTQTAYVYQSQTQQALYPGDSIEYTLGFDQANKGANQTISITANFDRAIPESNTQNDSASAKLTILGS